MSLKMMVTLEKYVGWDKLDPNIVGDPSCYQNILQNRSQLSLRSGCPTTRPINLYLRSSSAGNFLCMQLLNKVLVREQTNEKEPRAASSQKLVEPGTLF
ncbi:Uncharacterized protein APZ42_034464 [Daphnia magna]|uniref:Uncharacterized protein n=1 Tax=Daphnia magna TaxID=35525 RepID=A0A164K6S2_9CRUS|nr:Uncharacterized protein APZ42_034464 [Daphnia magna]